jgi:negative regulator of sigma F NrsF-like protein
VNDQQIDEMISRAARLPAEIDDALERRIAESIKPTLRPVKPLPPTWILASDLAATCALVAVGGAARAGFHGFGDLGPLSRGLIFSTLSILIWVIGMAFAGQMIPGSRRAATPLMLLGATTLSLLLVFAFLFRDYHTRNFISAGMVCLTTGLLHAIPAGLLGWIFLRRGFALNAVAAGMAGGTLAGLAGVGMLELQCNNFQALHILLWHTAVVPAAAAGGAAAGWAFSHSARTGSAR